MTLTTQTALDALLPDTGVAPLCLGGNVFGWTADEEASFAVLDAFLAGGGNFIDTADVYSAWLPGHQGGESETIIGRWMADRGVRDRVVIATKVGANGGLSAANIARGAQGSLERLQTDHIDLYYAHKDDLETPLEETLGAFDALVRAGSVRLLAASNYEADRLAQALAVSDREGFARYVALQPHYNLVEREAYEGPLSELCAAEGIACVPYFGLAKGFLTGKYRVGGAEIDSPRAASVRESYMNDRGTAVLAALDAAAAAHEVPVAAVSLAWLREQSTVAAPIASATSVTQLAELMRSIELQLTAEELAALDTASTLG
jgi:aryl-alcohol dehydrogenase-like predicted oxidoreductase